MEDPKSVSFQEDAKRELATNRINNPEGKLAGVKILDVQLETKMGRGGGVSTTRRLVLDGWHAEIPGAKLIIKDGNLRTEIVDVSTGG